MKLVRTEESIGQVICHDMTQIIVGVTKDARFRKGHIIREEDIPILLSMGKEHIYVWEMGEDMVHEDDAVEHLVAACENEFMNRSAVKEGKVELSAMQAGVLEIDVERLLQINSLGDVMIATRSNHSVVQPGDKIAGMRIIPLAISRGRLGEVGKIASASNPLLCIHPFSIKDCTILVTGNEVLKGLIKDTFSSVIEQKMAAFGVRTNEIILTGDDPQDITRQILRAKQEGASLIVCTGGMSVDPDDHTPGAIKASHAQVVSYGSPVLPGAMFMLSYLQDTPVLGLPGCVMYAKRTVLDLLLPRILCGVRLQASDVAKLGAGGLCLQCQICHFPNCSFGNGSL
jgi:molybdopterin biosynthesis enzyme